MDSISVGNVVSAGLRIYRDRFSSYFRLAFLAYLWIFVPIYGWAKFASIMGLISRLAFTEVTEHPETIQDANRYVKPRLWKFFGAGILVSLIFLGVTFILIFIASLVLGILAVTLGFNTSQEPTTNSIIIFGLLLLAAILLVIFLITWLISRLFITEVPLAIEDNMTATTAISRSWQLTKGSVFKIQLIVFVAFLITLPISIIVQIASTVIQILLGAIFPADSGIFVFLLVLAIAAISISSGALMIPFWQAIKAVIYYDLRVRREGFGIEL